MRWTDALIVSALLAVCIALAFLWPWAADACPGIESAAALALAVPLLALRSAARRAR